VENGMAIMGRIFAGMDQIGPKRALAIVASLALSACISSQTANYIPDIPELDSMTQDSMEELQVQANHNDPIAMATLGERYEHGDGVPLDPDEAIDWYRRAAAAGDPLAQFELGELYLNGGIQPRDAGRAAELFLRAAAQGHAAAMANFAMLYEQGRGVPQDYRRAGDFYALAALHADLATNGQSQPAETNGRALEGDIPADLRWGRRGARTMVADAQYALAQAHENGDGVQPDFTAAERWYRESADHGHIRAAEALQRLYADGSLALSTPSQRPVTAAPVMEQLPAPQAVSQPTTESVPPRPSSESYLVHLASYREVDEADDGWGDLVTQHGDLVEGLEVSINRVDVPDEGTFYRLQAGELADITAANALCDQLGARGAYCEPVVAQ
jgi:TPR repeat protein